jgi:large subunit ribosomal protein L7Ae
MGVPYVIVKGKARLGTVVHKKTATALAITDVTAEDKKILADLLTATKEAHSEKEARKWGGGIMGQKSVNMMSKRAKALAKSLQTGKKE